MSKNKRGYEIPQAQAGKPQIVVNPINEHVRVHGFAIGNVFFVVWPDPNHKLYHKKPGQTHLKNQSEFAYTFVVTDVFLDCCFCRNNNRWHGMRLSGIKLLSYLCLFLVFNPVIPAAAGIQRSKSELIISNAFALHKKP